MTKIKVNRDTCQGHGNCVMAYPAAFDLDDDALVVLKRDSADNADSEALRKAAYNCPTQSITIAEEA